MKIEKWWNDTNREIAVGIPEQNPVPLPLFPPQNPEIQYLNRVCLCQSAGFIMLQSVFD